PWHRVLVPRYDVRPRVDDRLADVFVSGHAWSPVRGDRSDVVERRSKTLPEQVRLVAVRAAESAVDLTTPSNGLGRRRLRSAGQDERGERDAYGDNASHHADGAVGRIPPRCHGRP